MADGGDMVERGLNLPAANVEVQATPKQSKVETRSILSEVLETHLLPPERFRDNQVGEIVDIKKIQETVAVVKKIQDHYEALILNEEGNPFYVGLDPTSKDLMEIISENLISPDGKISVLGNWHTDKNIAARLVDKLGFPQQAANAARLEWTERSRHAFTIRSHTLFLNRGINCITRGEIKSKPSIVLPAGRWAVDVLPDKNGQGNFIFSVEGGYVFKRSPKPPFKKERFNPKDFTTVPPRNLRTIGDLNIKKDDSSFHVIDKTGKELANYSGTSLTVDPSNPNNLHFIDKGQVFRLDLGGFKTPVAKPSVEQVDLQEIQDPQTLDFDPNGNFFVITAGDNKLLIVDKESGNVARTFENAKGPVLVDNQGNILFSDTDNRLREIQTNFPAITKEGAEELFKKREEALAQEKERLAKLEFEKIEVPQRGISQVDVANTLRETISRQVSEKIASSSNPEDLEDVLARLQTLKADPANQAYGGVIDEFVGKAREKLSTVRTTELEGSLSNYQQVLNSVHTAEDSIGLDQEFAKLLQGRQKTEITDYTKRREVDQRIRDVQDRKDTLISQYQQELVQGVESRFPQIQELVEECGSTHELAYLSTSGDVQHFEMMLANIRDPEVRREFRNRYNSIRVEHRGKLEERSRDLEKRQVEISAQIIEDARESLVELQEQVEHLSSVGEIDRFGGDPLVAAWRAKLSALPPELREIEDKRLEIILGSRKKVLEKRQELTAVNEEGVLKFGNTTFPVFKEPPRIWQPKLVPRKSGFQQWADLTFEDTQGRVWKPEKDHDVVVSSDTSDERTKETIERYRRKADEYFRGIKRKVPEFDQHWRITEYHMAKLEEIAEALNLQLTHHRGILILQGEAGTGKNVTIDMLANLSNREVITIACNENTVKEDLTYEFYYDPQRGTYKLPSKLVEGIQKPGAVVIWDEINALKPGIAKLHNPLFDYRRRIYLPEGGEEREIIADPTVLFVGTMNPQNYVGVNRLSPEVKSRARVIDIDYPPFEEIRGGRTQYRSDEAEMLAVHMDPLGGLNQKEFKLCWNYIINRDTTNGADRILQGDQTIEQDTRRIYDVIRVANRLRDMYRAFQIGDSNEPMDFPTSLREVIDIAMEMNHRQGVKPIIKRVIIPKIDEPRQKRLVGQTIDAILPN